MRARELDGAAELAVVLIFATGDELVDGLTAFARDQGLTAVRQEALRAFREATLGYFDWDTKEYLENPVDEEVEVVTLIGDDAVAREGASSMCTPCSAGAMG